MKFFGNAEYYEMPSQVFERGAQAEIDALVSLQEERNHAVNYWKSRSERLQRAIDLPLALHCLEKAGDGHNFLPPANSLFSSAGTSCPTVDHPGTNTSAATLSSATSSSAALVQNVLAAKQQALQAKLDSLSDEQHDQVVQFLAADVTVEDGADDVVHCDLDQLPLHRVQELADFVDGLVIESQPGSAHVSESSSSTAIVSAEDSGIHRLPRPILKDLWQDRSRRFIEELEFVQQLTDPNYVHFLATRGYLEDDSFIGFLRYLKYWGEPPYVQHLVYPQALRILEMLLTPEIRKRMRFPTTLALLRGSTMWKWANMPEAPFHSESKEVLSKCTTGDVNFDSSSELAETAPVTEVVQPSSKRIHERKELLSKCTKGDVNFDSTSELAETVSVIEVVQPSSKEMRSKAEKLSQSSLQNMRKNDQDEDLTEHSAKRSKLSTSVDMPADSGHLQSKGCAAGPGQFDATLRAKCHEPDTFQGSMIKQIRVQQLDPKIARLRAAFEWNRQREQQAPSFLHHKDGQSSLEDSAGDKDCGADNIKSDHGVRRASIAKANKKP